jgi:hypothetical protein
VKSAYIRTAVIVVAAVAVAACGGKTKLSNRHAPDEFAISRAAPLIVPPDYSLTPPRPGQPRALGQDGQTQAVEALFGPGSRVPPKSPAEEQLLDKAGAVGNNNPRAEPAVRSSAADPKTLTVDKGAFLRELMSARPGTTNAKVAEVKVGD